MDSVQALSGRAPAGSKPPVWMCVCVCFVCAAVGVVVVETMLGSGSHGDGLLRGVAVATIEFFVMSQSCCVIVPG